MSDDVLSDGEIPRSYNTWHRMHAQQQTDCNWASMYTGMELDQNQARHNGDITTWCRETSLERSDDALLLDPARDAQPC
ncbi:hypothetical protein OUZ56_024913 [Daphnia magna]|uniref:Uncharacterized protein n=1 Tax=Daphnia magna TaxID=35525 RepID=A0ABQ9ZID1_9CRUS|nr:hypothetical protein OUZ56_024913 [Daphnia magna]